MASLQTQVRALAGTATNELQWVNDGIRVVIDKLLSIDPESGYLFSQELSGSSSGATVIERQHILNVAKGSKAATEIPAGKRFAAAEATSLQKATADYPQYYVLDQKLYILPSGNFTYSAVDYTTLVNLSASTINNFPTSLIPLVVNYAAMKSLNETLVGYTGLSGLVLSLPSVPPQPALAFSLVSDGMTAVNLGGFPSASLPEYVSVADPSIATLSLSGFSVPTLPETPSFTYSDASLQKFFSDLSVSFSQSAPTYTAPIMQEINFTKITSLIETDEDIELAQSKLAEEQVKVTEFSSKLQDSLNKFNKENAQYQIEFQRSVQEFEHKTTR